jgi:hypothetical protein
LSTAIEGYKVSRFPWTAMVFNKQASSVAKQNGSFFMNNKSLFLSSQGDCGVWWLLPVVVDNSKEQKETLAKR